MRIGMLSWESLYSVKVGGIAPHVSEISEALAKRGHEIHVFCRETDTRREEFSISEDQIDGLRVTRAVNNLKDLPHVRAYYDNPFFDQAFLKILKELYFLRKHPSSEVGRRRHCLWCRLK